MKYQYCLWDRSALTTEKQNERGFVVYYVSVTILNTLINLTPKSLMGFITRQKRK